jgi:hypothetical protein
LLRGFVSAQDINEAGLILACGSFSYAAVDARRLTLCGKLLPINRQLCGTGGAKSTANVLLSHSIRLEARLP